jgi:hypothetical protein
MVARHTAILFVMMSSASSQVTQKVSRKGRKEENQQARELLL